MILSVRCLIACLCLAFLSAKTSADEPLSFRIELPTSVAKSPISGRLLVFFSKSERTSLSPAWFNTQPFFGSEVKDFEPGTTRVIDDTADCFPDMLSNLKEGKYWVHAVLDHSFYAPSPGDGVGNFFCKGKKIDLSKTSGVVELQLDQVIRRKSVRETARVRLVTIDSSLLEAFHNRPVQEKAVVLLPASYADEPERRYPVFYEISGFGGSIPGSAAQARSMARRPKADFEYIHVLLTGECKWGHHVYANSATNGPRGDAFVQEMIPHIDSRYRTVAEPTARFLGGHSSGGWSSLWLQITYPESFGGVWSTAPDPVDFRDYQQTNLYASPAESVYFFQDGSKKPLARQGNQVSIWYPDFGKVDDVLGDGGQLRSFEAVFSPLDSNGLPAKMWERVTGQVNPQVVEAWKKYDIGLTLIENWSTLAPKLEGKIHLLMGTEDTFYLDGAARVLKESLQNLGSDAQIDLVPGDHGSIMTPAFYKERQSQMQEAFLKHHAPQPVPSSR